MMHSSPLAHSPYFPLFISACCFFLLPCFFFWSPVCFPFHFPRRLERHSKMHEFLRHLTHTDLSISLLPCSSCSLFSLLHFAPFLFFPLCFSLLFLPPSSSCPHISYTLLFSSILPSSLFFRLPKTPCIPPPLTKSSLLLSLLPHTQHQHTE